ncbi:MAG: bifunctional adenosylcobinamide kinase/adenosylcobinamide-phosphate guanylyltransferase [Olsenella sp.]|jgi:alpha-ribazole phosphatase
MMLVTGGVASGKRTYVRSLGYAEKDLAYVGASGALPAPGAPVVVDAQLLALAGPVGEAALADLAGREVVVATEVGAGVVPAEPGGRAWRERAGRLACELAARADCVVRMVCGVPQVLKGEPAARAAAAADGAARAAGVEGASLTLVLLRHGRTHGNDLRLYVGSTDEPLSPEGELQARRAGICRSVPLVYVSPLARARQTAAICFPEASQAVVDGLRELDFGDFEGRGARDMEHDAAYRAWVDGCCVGRCPGGESRADLVGRTSAALEGILASALAHGDERVVVVAHGGTVMAAMSAFVDGPAGERDPLAYFRWQVDNLQGYRVEVSQRDGRCAFGAYERLCDLAFLG